MNMRYKASHEKSGLGRRCLQSAVLRVGKIEDYVVGVP